MSPILTWPENERPREKLLMQGSDALSDAELLAIFFRSGCRGKTAVDLARELLQQTKGLRGLFALDLEAFCQYQGLGKAKYSQLRAALEITSRYLLEQLHHDNVLSSAELTKQYIVSRISSHHYELFACLFLNNQFQLIRFVELFRGSVNQASVYPGEVVKQALHHHAAAVIIAHNHPSGDPQPSQADRELTETLKQALNLVDIRLVDHVIVAGHQAFSFAERGYLS